MEEGCREELQIGISFGKDESVEEVWGREESLFVTAVIPVNEELFILMGGEGDESEGVTGERRRRVSPNERFIRSCARKS